MSRLEEADVGKELTIQVVDAARAMARLHLVTAYGHVSARGEDNMIITPSRALGEVEPADLIEVPWTVTTLPAGCPNEAWAHLSLYRSRPDALSIARGQPPSTLAVSAVTDRVRPLHGQMAWLGQSIPVFASAQLLRTAALADDMANQFAQGEAILLRGNGAITLGDSPGTAVARLWLLEVACQVWLRAKAAGTPVELTEPETAAWRAVSQELLPRLWAYLETTE